MNNVRNTERCHNWRAISLLGLLAVASLMLVSPDSYLHDLFNRVDSAWYYICGKAWMEGMTPYVDFADSKGALLWLIYGLGYIISPRDYTGVFWLSCVAYTITLWLVYRSALTVLGNRSWALLCAILMLLAYFYPYIHEETKTEDFAQPFIAWCLYGCLTLIHAMRLQHAKIARIMVSIGLSIGCVFMIKYSFTPMLSIFAIYAMVAARHHKMKVVTSLGWLVIGGCIALVPWCIYFTVAGNFKAFIQEYFINTFDTLHYLREEHGTIIDILRKFRLHHVVTLFPLLCGAGAVLYTFMTNRMRSFALVVTSWFFLCTIPNAWWIYYYNSCTWTMFFGFTALLLLIQRNHKKQPSRWMIATMAIVVTLLTGAWSIAIVPQNFFLVAHKGRDTYYRYAYLMQQVERPTVIYWDIYGTGFETAAMGFPGCKYWAGQNGATPQMRQVQAQAVEHGDADFVMVADTLHDGQLKQWGYHKWDYNDRDNIDRCDDLLFTLYTRHNLQAPPDDFSPPSPREIVTKRWHLR